MIFETVAILHSTGQVSRMQIVVEAPASAFDGRGAANAGFTFDEASSMWKRILTPAMIAREISRTSFPTEARLSGGIRQPIGPMTRWKKIRPEDVFQARINFDSVPEIV